MRYVSRSSWRAQVGITIFLLVVYVQVWADFGGWLLGRRGVLWWRVVDRRDLRCGVEGFVWVK